MSTDSRSFGSRARTFMCSAVFIDIVEYSKRTVAKQLAQKGWLNELLAAALKGIPPDERILLDAGDGVAICFLGDPEDALFVTSSVRVALAESGYPEFALRMGINIGPVKAVQDLNGRPNVVGDGINVAQRVMSFAEPGQVLVSRSYYEVVLQLSEDHAGVLRFLGERRDKHGRSHEVYEVLRPRDTPSADAGSEPECASGPTQAPEAAAFDRDDLVRLEALLAAALGPMAGVLVKDAAKTARDRRAIIAALAEAIDHPGERASFVSAARDCLAHRLD